MDASHGGGARAIGAAAAFAAALASALMLLSWLGTDDPPDGAYGELSFAEVFAQPRNRAEVMINRRDGPAFAQLATDLDLDDASGFHDYFAGSTPEEELAYRAGRPMLAWLTWAASLGARRELLAPALMALSVASIAALAAASAALATNLGRDGRWAVAVVALPGVMVSIWAPGGCEPLAAALAIGGLLAWSSGRPSLAVATWCAAVLARETMLIVPVSVAVLCPLPFRRRAFVLAGPSITYGAWTAVILWRTGMLPGNAGGGRVALFFSGFGRGVTGWGLAEWAMLALLIAFGVVLWRTPIPGIRGIVVLHGILASTLGPLVWEKGIDFTRVFLLIEVMGLVALLPRHERSRAVPEAVGSSA